jgi:hypothetical protein
MIVRGKNDGGGGGVTVNWEPTEAFPRINGKQANYWKYFVGAASTCTSDEVVLGEIKAKSITLRVSGEWESDFLRHLDLARTFPRGGNEDRTTKYKYYSTTVHPCRRAEFAALAVGGAGRVDVNNQTVTHAILFSRV